MVHILWSTKKEIAPKLCTRGIRQHGGSSAEAAAVAAAQHRDVGNSMSAAQQCWEHEARRRQTMQRRQRGGSSVEAAAVAAARHRDVGNSMSAERQCREHEARQRQTARRRQRGGSCTEAVAVVAARHRDVGDSMSAARQCREREARRPRIVTWGTARRQLCGQRNTEAAPTTSKHIDSYIWTNNRHVKKELEIFPILVAGSVGHWL